MTHPNPSTAFARVVVDELVRSGITVVVAAPGSRSTALVLAAANHPEVDLAVALDERSAAFHALGSAKRTGRPAAVITTSGTAVANLTPAVVEAHMASTPLIALSADRPHELRGVGANQAIDQTGMFGGFVRLMLDIGPPEPRAEAPRFWRSSVSRAVAATCGFGGRPGPVHLNLAFREPTVPVSDDGRSREEPFSHDTSGRDGGEEWTAVTVGHRLVAHEVERAAALIAGARRGVVVAGAGTEGDRSVAELGLHLGWPVLATAESGLRGGDDVIGTGHHLAGRTDPDLVIRFGAPGPSRRMMELVSGAVPQIVVASTWSDPDRVAGLMIDADAVAVARTLIQSTQPRSPGQWHKWWQEADRAVQAALAPELTGTITEPAMAAATCGAGADVLTVASSMPIRDVEAYAFAAPAIVANRGASGIDGFVSTALGASRGAARPLAFTGDLSLLHDSNGFVVDPRPSCVFVVADNGGGGIFSFLPQAEHVGDQFERLFGTPSGRDLGHLATLHGLGLCRVAGVPALMEAVESAWQTGGCHLIVGETDRDENVVEHTRLNRLAAEAVATLPQPQD